MLLLHTAHWTSRHDEAEALLKAIEPLAIPGLSLDDRISPKLWEELRPALGGKGFFPAVIHSPLPAPPWLLREREKRDDLLLASADGEKRERAVAATLRTLELAADARRVEEPSLLAEQLAGLSSLGF